MRKFLLYTTRTAEDLFDWFCAVLPLLRVIVPAIMLNVMASKVHSVYISELGMEISSVAMRCFVLVGHIIAVWCGMKTGTSRGWLYEVASCFLATEMVLFLYYMQYRFAVAILLALVFSIGLVWLSIYGRKQLMCSYRRGHIPQVLMDDIIASSKDGKKVTSVFSVALRRYLVIAPAILLIAPSFMMIYNYDVGGTKHIGNEHAIINDTNDNQIIANLSTIWLLENTVWNQLDDQQKVNALQVIADIETNYMGINPVVVVNCHLENQTIGAYDHSERQVHIDLEKHNGYDSLEYVNTILHECRHAYQHDCVDSLDWDNSQVQSGIYFAQARTWRYEQNNYVSANENRDAYLNQMTEKDARYYADEGSQIYQQYIYLSNLPPR